jgi:hypothetical protein
MSEELRKSCKFARNKQILAKEKFLHKLLRELVRRAPEEGTWRTTTGGTA